MLLLATVQCQLVTPSHRCIFPSSRFLSTFHQHTIHRPQACHYNLHLITSFCVVLVASVHINLPTSVSIYLSHFLILSTFHQHTVHRPQACHYNLNFITLLPMVLAASVYINLLTFLSSYISFPLFAYSPPAANTPFIVLKLIIYVLNFVPFFCVVLVVSIHINWPTFVSIYLSRFLILSTFCQHTIHRIQTCHYNLNFIPSWFW